MEHLKLELVDFIDWLEECEPSEVVGMSNHDRCCPIANYINESSDGDEPMGVQQFTVTDHRGVDLYDLPGWAQAFVELVDLPGKSVKITAEKALGFFS